MRLGKYKMGNSSLPLVIFLENIGNLTVFLTLISQPINVEFDIGTTASVKMQIVDIYKKDSNQGAEGGIHSKSNGFTMLQNVWHTYQLQNRYVVDDLSRLEFAIQLTDNAKFIGLCLSSDMKLFDSSSEKQPLCIHLFGQDPTWKNSGLPVIPYNLALGKPTEQYSVLDSYEGSNAVDGNLETVMNSDLVQNPYWQVDLQRDYMIGSIVLHRATDADYESIDDRSGLSIMAYDKRNIKVYQSDQFTMSEAVLTFNPPINTVASRVVIRITDSKKRMLSLKEVQIFPAERTTVGRMFTMDLPIGSLFNGNEVNFVTFVQGGDNALSKVSSYISGMKFLYGSIPELQQ
jgi:hypothetical protein